MMLCLASPSQAQDRATGSPQPPANSEQPDDAADQQSNGGAIVVTALRREQRLQDVPLAISVIDGELLREKGTQDYRDYLTTVPGVTFAEGGLRGVRVAIRGISDGVGATAPLTAIYLDEAPITETYTSTLDPNVFDIERVEVLRGPQGTLYGSGSMGGTIRVITRKPQLNQVEGAADAALETVESGGINWRANGVINLPVVDDRLALRVSGGYRKDGGWIDNVALGLEDVNTVEKTNLRGQLLFAPGLDTSVILSVIHQSEDLGGPFQDYFATPVNTTASLYREGGSTNAELYSLTVEHELERFAITSASNYTVKDTDNIADGTASLTRLVGLFTGVLIPAGEGLGVRSASSLDLFTQEVRLSTTGSNAVDFVVGGFYSNGTTDFRTNFDFSQAPSLDGVVTEEEFYLAQESYQITQIAAFGELTWNITDRLALTAGLRGFDVNQRDISFGSGLLNGGERTSARKGGGSSVTQKYLVDYEVSHDHMIYATAAQGYRNGGATGGFPLAPCQTFLDELGYDSVPTQYDPDKLWNYEIGSKNSFAGGTVTLNGAAYYIDWSDIQASVGLACGFTFIANAGEARSMGFELEGSVRPVDGLVINAALAYTDAELTAVAPGFAGQEGDPLPFVADWSWNVAATYEHELGAGLDGFLRGEVNHVGPRWNTFRSQTARAIEMDGYTTLALRAGVRGENWGVAIYGRNLTDERIVLNAIAGRYENISSPRVIGIAANYDF
jgi:outer membrane receptor protein involved in Fe transport